MDKPRDLEIGPGFIEFDHDGPVVDARLIGDLLKIPEHQVSGHIQKGTITTLYEKGIDDHEGGFRLSFFHHNRRAQLEVDCEGLVSSRTVIDFGDRPLPASLRGPSSTPPPRTQGHRITDQPILSDRGLNRCSQKIADNANLQEPDKSDCQPKCQYRPVESLGKSLNRHIASRMSEFCMRPGNQILFRCFDRT